MRMFNSKSFVLSALLLVIGVAACESNSGPTSPATLPSFSVTPGAHSPTKVRGSVSDQVPTTVAKRIGSEGGVIDLGGHRLSVPVDAVNAPVLFRMTLQRDGYVEVDLTATGTGNRAGVDVGSRGFARPVGLRFSYAAAEGVADASRLKIVWVKEDGTLETLHSTVDATTQTVTAQLEHFSKYAMAFE